MSVFSFLKNLLEKLVRILFWTAVLILAAITVFFTVGLTKSWFGMVGLSKISRTESKMGTIECALIMYEFDHDGIPGEAEGLEKLLETNVVTSGKPANIGRQVDPYLSDKDDLKDAWGNEFHYTVDGSSGEHEIISYGADGIPGGTVFDADILWSECCDPSNWEYDSEQIGGNTNEHEQERTASDEASEP